MNSPYAFFIMFVLIGYNKFHVASQIVDGKIVKSIEDHNYIVGMQITVNNTCFRACVASIVSPWKIVTAAHCIHNSGTATLILGTLVLDKPHQTLDVTIDDIFIHSNYSGKIPLAPHMNDIAVIRLKKALKFGSRIGKIDMVHENYLPSTGERIKMLGFSKSIGPNRTHSFSPLQSVYSTITDFETCSDLYWKHKKQCLVEGRQFCVDLRNGVHNTNNGDSGGPVITSDGKLLGIISQDLNGFPEVNVLISGYREFISNPWRIQRNSNGQVYKIEEYNYIAAILYTKNTTTNSWFGWQTSQSMPYTCAATILSNNKNKKIKIVTAAHCVYDTHSVSLAFATINTDEPYYTVKISEEVIHVHPEYTKSAPYNNDIAVIELKTALIFGPKIGKIEMIDRTYVAKPGSNVTILGYSDSIDPKRKYSDTHLRYVDSNVADSDKFQKLKDMEEGRTFCTTLKIPGYSGGTKRQYSGGPVITKDKKFLGIFSQDMNVNGLPKVCNYRYFIDNPKGR